MASKKVLRKKGQAEPRSVNPTELSDRDLKLLIRVTSQQVKDTEGMLDTFHASELPTPPIHIYEEHYDRLLTELQKYEAEAQQREELNNG